MGINPYVKNILEILSDNPGYITISHISDEIGISTRTVLRLMKDVEKWLTSRNFVLEKKTGTGIRLSENEEDRKKIRLMLDEENTEKIFTPNERRIISTVELLIEQEPVKLYVFTTMFKVSESTIGNDLDKIEKWLKKFNLILNRKQGLGVFIEGDEQDIRKASIALFFENFEESELLDFIRNNVLKGLADENKLDIQVNNKLLKLIDKNRLTAIGEFVHKLEKSIGYNLADTAFVAIAIGFAIAIKRIKNCEYVVIDNKLLRQLKKTKEYKIILELTNEISSKNNIKISEDEIGYITTFVIGAKSRDVVSNSEVSMIQDYKLIRITKDIIRLAQSELGVYLEENEKLLIGLVKHLGPSINRIKLEMDIENPLVDEIKRLYPKLYKAAEKSAGIIEKAEGIEVPDDEVAFIAMHLGAAVQRIKNREFYIFKIAIACPSGIATSRLISSQINKEFDNIEISENISVIDINGEQLLQKGIDFIISTVPISALEIPVVIVNEILTQADKVKIEKQLVELQKKERNKYRKNIKQVSFKDKARVLDIYSKMIMQVLDNFNLYEFEKIKNVDELILKTGNSLVENSKLDIFINDMKEREEKGSTILRDKKIMLLHCRSSAVNELMFILVRLPDKLKVYYNELSVMVDLIVVMIAPVKIERQGLEIMSEFSKIISVDDNFVNLLKSATGEEIYMALNTICDEFYSQKCMNISDF